MAMLTILLGVAALLVVPGPTNVLLAAGGAAGGLAAGLRLGVAAAAGYLASVAALVVVAGPAVAAHPVLPVALKAAAAVWLVACALRLWRHPSALGASGSPVRVPDVLVTTLLNPKGLVFAFALAPAASWPLPAFLGALAVLTIGSCLLWAALGRFAARGLAGRVTLAGLNKGGAVVLTGFAAALGLSTLG